MALIYCNEGQQEPPGGNTVPRGKKRNSSERDNEEEFWLHKICKDRKTTEELVPLIVSEIEAAPNYYKNVIDMCWHLDKIMKFFYKDQHVAVRPFGSADTRLAIRSSDVDIFLDFQGNLPESPQKLLRTLRNRIKKFGYFNQTFAIFARTPIIQSVHCSGLSCDLSFLNSSAVSNSQLIKFLLSLDVRIRPLILILKYFMKSQGLIGSNAFTSYSLVLLILFVLQTLKNPIIPSIVFIQNLSEKPDIIANWDTAFTTENNHLPEVNNNMSVAQLLQEFFQFYSTFEFGFYVISLYTAKTYLKTIFSDANLVPVEFQLYKKNLAEGKCEEFEYKRFVCVQDPFNHSFNVNRNTTQKCLIQFQQLCSAYAEKGKKLWETDESEDKKIEFVVSLFDLRGYAPKNKKMMLYEPILIYVGQEIDFGDPNCTEDDLRKRWSDNIFKSVTDILTKIMKCELDIQTKQGGDLTSTSFESEKIINCVLPHLELVTKKRNEVKGEFDFPKEMPIIIQEELISNYLCDTLLKDARKIFLKFDITCFVQKGPTCFCMKFDSKNENKARGQMIQQVFKFLQNSVKWIK